MNTRWIGLIAGLLASLGGATSAQTSWDAVGDFRLDINPSGAWSYNWQLPGFSEGRLMKFQGTDCGNIPGVDCWNQGDGSFVTLPMVGINVTGAPIVYTSVVVPVNVLVLHPGAGGESSLVTWTAPANGTYMVTAQFKMIDRYPTGVQVSVRVDRATIRGKSLTAYRESALFKFNRTLTAGQTISFVVAPAGLDENDSTALKVGITRLD